MDILMMMLDKHDVARNGTSIENLRNKTKLYEPKDPKEQTNERCHADQASSGRSKNNFTLL
jgi:hypothetical protein